MADFLIASSGLIMLITATGLLGVWRWGGAADRMMALQLLGTGSICVLLLLAVAQGNAAVLDVALLLAVLAACATAAFRAVILRGERRPPRDAAGERETP